MLSGCSVWVQYSRLPQLLGRSPGRIRRSCHPSESFETASENLFLLDRMAPTGELGKRLRWLSVRCNPACPVPSSLCA